MTSAMAAGLATLTVLDEESSSSAPATLGEQLFADFAAPLASDESRCEVRGKG